jgi:hypothetical protein
MAALYTWRQSIRVRPLLFWRGLEFVLVGLANRLMFHTTLFWLSGRKTATIHPAVAQRPGYAVATGHLAFIPIAQAGGLSRIFARGSGEEVSMDADFAQLFRRRLAETIAWCSAQPSLAAAPELLATWRSTYEATGGNMGEGIEWLVPGLT